MLGGQLDGRTNDYYDFHMENKEFKIGVFLRNALLLAFGFLWFAFIVAVITSDPPTADCAGKSEADCKVMQQKIDEDHQQSLNTLFLNMG